MPPASPFVSLYTDEDVTSMLAPALRRYGYRVKSTSEANNLGQSDQTQLQYATQQGMAIITHNARDFIPIAREWYFAGQEHAGIIIAQQFSQREFGEFLRQMLRLFDSLRPEQLRNRVVFLQQFQPPA